MYSNAMRSTESVPYQRFKEVITVSVTGQVAMAALYGLDVARPMIEVHFSEADVKVTGFTSPVALTRSNRKEITFFVNGRWVQDSALSAALRRERNSGARELRRRRAFLES